MTPRSKRPVVVTEERALVMTALDREIAAWLDVIEAMNVVCERLGMHLERWIGEAGWRGLLARSLAEVAHGDPLPLVLDADGRWRWTRDGGAALARHACIEVLVAAVRSLCRIIGATLALGSIELGLASRAAPSEGNDHG